MFSRHDGWWLASTFSMGLHLRHGYAGYIREVILACRWLIVDMDGWRKAIEEYG